MRIRMRSRAATARWRAEEGDVVDVPNAEAEQLIRGGYAVEAEPAPEPEPSPIDLEDPEPEPASRRSRKAVS